MASAAWHSSRYRGSLCGFVVLSSTNNEPRIEGQRQLTLPAGESGAACAESAESSAGVHGAVYMTDFAACDRRVFWLELDWRQIPIVAGGPKVVYRVVLRWSTGQSALVR